MMDQNLRDEHASLGSHEGLPLKRWITARFIGNCAGREKRKPGGLHGANPPLLLATNFEVPESTFKDFQTRNRFLVG